MPRYVAFLRGVSPMNLKMSDLKLCIEKSGFTHVKTVLSSGNAVFDSPKHSIAAIESQIESALSESVGRSFHTIVRPVSALEKILKDDPYAEFKLPAEAKRVVTFGRKLSKPSKPLPIASEGAQILSVREGEAFSAYVPNLQGPVFMQLIEATFGKDVTTRTLETVRKCAKA